MIGVIDAELGNLRSLTNALDSLGFDVQVVTSPAGFDGLSHLIIPGVGSYATAMHNIRQKDLFQSILDFQRSGRPLLGICLGMQVLSETGEEVRTTEGLGLVPGKVVSLPQNGLPVPHVGWNSVRQQRPHPVFRQVKDGVDFYFVHSFVLQPAREEIAYGTTEYGHEFCSVVARENVVGFQFHPEKSQANGLRLLENFCLWDGRC